MVSTLKKFYGRHHELVYPYNVAVSRIEIFLMFLPLKSHRQTFKILDIPFSRPFPSHLSSDWYAWWAKPAYQIMLKLHWRLITPFLVGSRFVISLSIYAFALWLRYADHILLFLTSLLLTSNFKTSRLKTKLLLKLNVPSTILCSFIAIDLECFNRFFIVATKMYMLLPLRHHVEGCFT